MDDLYHIAAGWRIRPSTPEDYRPIARVFLDCLPAFPWRSNPRRELMGMENALLSCESYVATEEQAGVIGFIILDPVSGYVSHLFVDEDWRFCGVGSGLLSAARIAADKPLELHVDDLNTDALRAYQSMGWTEAMETPQTRQGQKRLISP